MHEFLLKKLREKKKKKKITKQPIFATKISITYPGRLLKITVSKCQYSLSS